MTIISYWQRTLSQYNDCSIMCVMFLISTLSFRASLYPLYCSASLSNHLILPLCLCEEACPPAGPGCWDARLKGPRKEHF